ncbi:MAG: ABC transporter ATP-binding protein [Ferrovibrionaceae bacterium]
MTTVPAAAQAAVKIAVDGVGMVYGRERKVQALARVDLDIADGEFVVLLGASGCGKTTLLRIIGGLLKPTEGAIVVDRRPLWQGGKRDGAVADQIGFVFQDANLFPWMTIAENIALPLRLRGATADARRQVAGTLCAKVGISGFEDAYPRQLSGGMRQRAAIARALSYDPSILLMDEPFGALDALTREQMNLELQRIWLANRGTVVLVTHSIAEAIFLADRIVVLTPRPGKIETIVPVGFPRPRTMAIQREQAFHELQDRLRDLLGVSDHVD